MNKDQIKILNSCKDRKIPVTIIKNLGDGTIYNITQNFPDVIVYNCTKFENIPVIEHGSIIIFDCIDKANNIIIQQIKNLLDNQKQMNLFTILCFNSNDYLENISLINPLIARTLVISK